VYPNSILVYPKLPGPLAQQRCVLPGLLTAGAEMPGVLWPLSCHPIHRPGHPILSGRHRLGQIAVLRKSVRAREQAALACSLSTPPRSTTSSLSAIVVSTH
jgi:hypothetical protein